MTFLCACVFLMIAGKHTHWRSFWESEMYKGGSYSYCCRRKVGHFWLQQVRGEEGTSLHLSWPLRLLFLHIFFHSVKYFFYSWICVLFRSLLYLNYSLWRIQSFWNKEKLLKLVLYKQAINICLAINHLIRGKILTLMLSCRLNIERYLFFFG